jgi:tripartite-type tricarboxylate transporter receptor subunit TctC
MGISAVGPRLLSEWFRIETGTRYTLVPYRGSGPAVQDLASGQIGLFFGTPDLLSLARAGSTKVHAATSDKRLAIAPEVPTFAELGLPKISWSAWYGLFAPKGTAKEVVSQLNAAAVEALADLALRSRLIDLGFEIFPRAQQTPEVLGALVKVDAERTWPLIKAAGIKQLIQP